MNNSKGPNKLLVVGSAGFVGSTFKQLPNNELEQAGVELLNADTKFELLDQSSLRTWLRHFEPDYVVHLAAQTFVPESLRNPRHTYKVNFFGTLNLLEALSENGFTGRFLYIGSGDAYGLVTTSDLPVSETRPLRPRNPYAVSKAAAEALCHSWSCTSKYDVIMARPFNHIGPGQSENFVVSGLAKQIAQIKLERQQSIISAGDVDVTRDFTDVRDVVRAYLLLLCHGASGETYNVCSGIERSVREILKQLLAIADVNAEIKTDPNLARPSEQRRMRGSPEKLRATTGWQPQIGIEQTLNDTLSYWERKLSHG